LKTLLGFGRNGISTKFARTYRGLGDLT
jgi:hypothetical protein